MNVQSSEIERIVREVLASVGQVGNQNVGQVGNLSPKDNSGQVNNLSYNDDLTLTSRVVSMDELIGRLDSIRRVVVQRRAIVTPAVRDELIRRGIALEFSDSNEEKKPAVRVLMLVTGTDFNAAPLAAALEREGFGVERSADDCLIATVDRLAGEIGGGETLGVLLTPHTAAGLCLANRLPGVRAIGGRDVTDVSASADAVGANLLVADPTKGSFFQLKQIATAFVRGGVRRCPAVFSERLR